MLRNLVEKGGENMPSRSGNVILDYSWPVMDSEMLVKIPPILTKIFSFYCFDFVLGVGWTGLNGHKLQHS